MQKHKNVLIVITLVIVSALLLVGHTSVFGASKVTATTRTKQTVIDICANIATPKAIIVSIVKRHLWACELTTEVYSSGVVTGDENIIADATPTGTFMIYAKETDRYLIGTDEKGSWNVHVDYWMPFLDNQYGTFGFHDADWRTPSEFGHIDPHSSQASHGCVELPTITARWLYNWASVGTQVEINA